MRACDVPGNECLCVEVQTVSVPVTVPENWPLLLSLPVHVPSALALALSLPVSVPVVPLLSKFKVKPVLPPTCGHSLLPPHPFIMQPHAATPYPKHLRGRVHCGDLLRLRLRSSCAAAPIAALPRRKCPTWSRAALALAAALLAAVARPRRRAPRPPPRAPRPPPPARPVPPAAAAP